MRRCLLLLAALLVLPACTGYKAPTVSVVDATVVDTTEGAVAVHFTLDLANPNPAPLELREIEYAGSLNGAAFEGRRASELTLPASGSDRILLPAAFPIERMTAGVDPTGELEYGVNGTVVYVTPQRLAEILLDTRLYRPKAHFSGAGTLIAP